METLYKGRYLIALYDKDDYLVDVATKPSDFRHICPRTKTFYEQKSKGIQTLKGYKVFLIDCLEKHDDIFVEEDNLFLNYVKAHEKSIDKQLEEIAIRYGVSKRTAYRWKKLGILKGF